MPDSASPLESWLQENADGITLQQLAFASGVRFESLRQFAYGESLPDWSHIHALRRVIPNIPMSLLEGHQKPAPVTVATGRGSVPPNCTLLSLPVEEIQPGDFLAYIPSAKSLRSKSHWIQVEAIRHSGRVAKIDFYEIEIAQVNTPVKLAGTHPVRVARINANDTDDRGA